MADNHRTDLERLVGRFIGLIGSVDESSYTPDDARWSRVVARVGRQMPLNGFSVALHGTGMNTTRSEARQAAIAEAFERNCLTVGTGLPVLHASGRALRSRGMRHVRPADLACFTDEQYGSAGFPLSLPPDDSEEISWLAGRDLVTGDDVAIPAQYCLGVCPGLRKTTQRRWYTATSNGAGTGNSPISACLSGFFELVERDAFMWMWYHRLRFPHLAIQSGSRLSTLVSQRLKPAGLHYRLIDLTKVHNVPTVVAVVWRESHGRPVYGVGAAAAATLPRAAPKALGEAVAVYSGCRFVLASGGAPPLDTNEITEFRHHPEYYLDPSRQRELEFLIDKRDVIPLPDSDSLRDSASPARLLRSLTRRLKDQAGIETYAVDLTAPDANLFGIYTYRVVSPHLIPLDCGHLTRHLGHARLRTGPDGLPVQPSNLNHAPHPFP